MNFNLVRRLAWRDWRSGELGLLLAALLVAVATVTSISLFVDRLQQALLNESADFLAADRYISSSRPLPDSFREAAQARSVVYADTLLFPSMVFADGETNQLASVKAVSQGYPLRGRLRIADVPFTDGYFTDELPAPGEIWLDARLFPALGVAVGDTLEVGLAELTISKVITSEPDRGGSMLDLGPRVLMRLVDVPATEVVQPGSRLTYRLLLKGEAATLKGLKDQLNLTPSHRWVSIRDSSPSIGAALDRAERFLLLGGLLGVLLACVAVALAAHRYARRHFDHVAVLKTLGATPRQILGGYSGVLGLIGSVAVALGLFAGWALHVMILWVLKSMLPVVLPASSVKPYLLGAVTGLICTFAFAMPAFLRLHKVAPVSVIKRNFEQAPTAQYLTYALASLGVLALLLWYSESLMLTFWTLLGTLATLLIFGVLATLILMGGRGLGMQAGSIWRLVLAGLQRRRVENVTQILVFGLAIMLLLILVLLRTSLLDEWQQQIPEDAPNHFVMNIDPERMPEFRSLLADADLATADGYAMVRGRITSVNETPAKLWQEKLDAKTQTPGGGGPQLQSERNLTWSTLMPQGNELVDGQWWGVDEPRSLVSLEEDYARQLDIQVGDRLSFDIGGMGLDVEVGSVRRLAWESMRPNFFIIFSPGALESFPATFMTSFHLPKKEKRFLNKLLSQFPTVTVIEVDALIAQVQSIISRVTQAVELVLYLVLASGCLVLIASIQASRDARMTEHALVRTLGGTRRLVAGSLALEFALLGAISGLLGAFGAEVTVALLQRQVFELPMQLHPLLWLLGPLLGGCLILCVGVISTRSLVSTPPMMVLRGLTP